MLDCVCHQYGWEAKRALQEVPLASMFIMMRQRKFANGDEDAGNLAKREFISKNKDELKAFLTQVGENDGR